MNKYEKAIDNVTRYCSDYRTGIFPPRYKLSNELDILQKLVDRATPKKVKQIVNHFDCEYAVGRCPHCGVEVYRDETYIPDHCFKCTQALLWEDEQ